MRGPVELPGAEQMSEGERLTFINLITPRWFATYGTAVGAGRDIDDRDTEAGPPVVVVNDAFVRKGFPGRNAIGETIVYWFGPGVPVPKTIIGVVGDAVYISPREVVQPTTYIPLAQREFGPPTTDISISVRASVGSPVLLARSVATALTGVDDNLAFRFRLLRDQVNSALAQERLVAMLSVLFGALALLLAGLGLYGVTSYAVTRRQSEIGIRMALGATETGIVRLVLSRVALLVGAGVVIGAAVSAWASRFAATMLYGLEPRDPATFLGAAPVLVVVGLLAGWVPARRASRLEPMVALRHE